MNTPTYHCKFNENTVLIFMLWCSLLAALYLLIFVARGLSTLFLPVLGIVISTRLLLAFVTVVQILLVVSVVIAWRSL
jgi:hypothetical protein